MPAFEAPKANPERILSIIDHAFAAKIVMPEFQRPFIWAREDIEEFLASILCGFFVGTFLLLDTPADNPMFPYRPVEGLELVDPGVSSRTHATVRLVLDGQQRITSLFYALHEPDISLRWAQYPHKFFLDLDLALSGDIDEAVVGVSTRDNRRMAIMRERQRADRALSFALLRDSSAFHRWLYSEQQVWSGSERDRIESFYRRFDGFMVPVVSLSPETGRDNIVSIFERINRTGISLSLFDLAAARLYLKGVNLRKLWAEFTRTHEDAARDVKPEFLLKVVALIRGKEPRHGSMLETIDPLDADTFRELWGDGAEAVASAYRRIRVKYGASDSSRIPYTTMVVPLALLLRALGKARAGEEAYRKVDRWYWGSVFSQRYDSAVNTKSYQDVRDVLRWLSEGVAPQWLERLGEEDLDLGVEESRSAIYRGILCLVARNGARDFLTGQAAALNQCQDDHIFPQKAYGNAHPVNVVYNRTLISKETNNNKRDNDPASFLRNCLRGHGDDEARLLTTLQTHYISERAYSAMLRDDFEGFVAERRSSLEQAVRSLLTSGE